MESSLFQTPVLMLFFAALAQADSKTKWEVGIACWMSSDILAGQIFGRVFTYTRQHYALWINYREYGPDFSLDN